MGDISERRKHKLKKTELERKLIKMNIRPDMYSLKGGLPNEKFCLSEANGRWEVYYSERGNKTGLKEFDNEDDACQCLYDMVYKTSKSMGLI